MVTNAPQHEVTTAYERAKNTYSGDNPAIYTVFSDHEARELLKMIEEAYSVLGNKTLRNIYDQRLFAGNSSQGDLSYQALVTASRAHLPEFKAEEASASYKVDAAFEAKIKEEKNWTGSLLKAVREYKKISIQKMADKTKIKSFYVNAIESMTPEELPVEVFVRGYVVQISKELGLNDKLVADSYMKNFKASLKN
jgi:curved DNA-binding protein CbpA